MAPVQCIFGLQVIFMAIFCSVPTFSTSFGDLSTTTGCSLAISVYKCPMLRQSRSPPPHPPCSHLAGASISAFSHSSFWGIMCHYLFEDKHLKAGCFSEPLLPRAVSSSPDPSHRMMLKRTGPSDPAVGVPRTGSGCCGAS